jgi:hypothetical protein
MAGEDSRQVDSDWDTLADYRAAAEDGEDAVTVSVSNTPGEWLVNTDNSMVVPMSMVEVVEALRAGRLTERSLVWRSGMQEWAPAGSVPQLRLAARLPVAAHVPPKLPLKRTSTLPFGVPERKPAALPQPIRVPAPDIAPRAREALEQPARGVVEQRALAVYDRPIATATFPPAIPIPAPETLAPITRDSPAAAPELQWHESSVVAASQFRALRERAQRVTVLASVASAALASLVTFALVRRVPVQAEAPQMSPRAPHAAVAAAPSTAPLEVAPLATPSASVALPEQVPTSAPAASPSQSVTPKRRSSRRRVAERVATPEAITPEARSAPSESADGTTDNPYAAKAGAAPTQEVAPQSNAEVAPQSNAAGSD